MAYITENQFANIIDIPVALPETKIAAGDWLIVSSFAITPALPLTATITFLQLGLVSSSGTPTVNLWIVKNYDLSDPTPTSGTSTLNIVTDAGGPNPLVVNTPQVVQRNINYPLTITDAGTYSFLVKTTDDAVVTVVGSVRLNVAP